MLLPLSSLLGLDVPNSYFHHGYILSVFDVPNHITYVTVGEESPLRLKPSREPLKKKARPGGSGRAV
jgi:hypothetical protein